MHLGRTERAVFEPVERDVGVPVKCDITVVFHGSIYESVESVVDVYQMSVSAEETVSFKSEDGPVLKISLGSEVAVAFDEYTGDLGGAKALLYDRYGVFEVA